jgi:WD40 repeat protein
LLFLTTGMAAGASEKPKPNRAEPVRTDVYGDPLPPRALARLGTVRLRHPTGADAVAFSPDGKLLASGGRDGLVRLWDRVAGKERHRLKGHDSEVHALAFTPDDKILASGGNSLVILWDVARGEEIRRLPGHRNFTPGLAFAPDGKHVVTAGGDGILRVHETSTGKPLWSVNSWEGAGIFSAIYSPNGRFLLSLGGLQPRLRMWDAANGKELRHFLSDFKGIAEMALSADGKRLATANVDQTVRLWEIASGKEVGRHKTDGPVASLAFAPDGQRIAAAISKGPIRVWDIADGEVRQIQDSTEVHPLAFALDNKTLVGGGGTTIRLWDAATGKDLFPPRGPRSSVTVLGFAPDGKTLTSVSLDDTVWVWDADSGKELRRSGGMRAWCSIPTFTPEGRLFMLERALGEVRLWDATAGTKPRHFQVIPPEDPFHSIGGGGVNAAALSFDGKRVAAHDADGSVRVWDVGSGKELCWIKMPYPRPENMVFAPDGQTLSVSTGGLFDAVSGKQLSRGAPQVFSPDGKMAAVGGINGIVLWDVVSDGKPREFQRTVRSQFYGPIAFAPGGRSVAARAGGFPGGGALWDVRTGKLLAQLTVRPEEENDLIVFAFSPDGRTLALGMWDQTIRLWDAFTGQEIRRFHGHQDAVVALAFSPDGRKLASGSRDGTALIWDLTDGISESAPNAEELRVLWDDLDGTDAVRADRAFWTLAATPKAALPLLRERLRADNLSASPDLDRLIANLDDEHFAVREKAQRELERLEERADSALRRALDAKPSLEARRRLQRLLARLAQKSADLGPLAIGQLRAVRLGEQIGTYEARAVLERIAVGSADTALARDAGAALLRLQRRK